MTFTWWRCVERFQ